MKIDDVFIFCSKRDYSILKVSIPNIIKYIDAKSYTIVCDKEDKKQLQTFRKYNIKIISDQAILKKRIKFIKINDIKLYRWYKQQIVKLEVCKQSGSKKISLLWDGDTIPLKQLNFTSKNNFLYAKSSEHHETYFYSLEKLLGISKLVNHSFISQCFILRNIWVKLLIGSIEKRSNKNYISVISDLANNNKGPAFSEYESLGNFIIKYFSYEIECKNLFWTRYGYSIFGNVTNINSIPTNLSFVTFEWWDRNRGSFSKILIRMFYYFNNVIHGILYK